MTVGNASLNAARRARELDWLETTGKVDVLVIGGGVTGAGVALDAAARGLTVALVEKHDLAFGTSRWSSKLVHGGLRYLASGPRGHRLRERCRARHSDEDDRAASRPSGPATRALAAAGEGFAGGAVARRVPRWRHSAHGRADQRRLSAALPSRQLGGGAALRTDPAAGGTARRLPHLGRPAVRRRPPGDRHRPDSRPVRRPRADASRGHRGDRPRRGACRPADRTPDRMSTPPS